jgi:hypothetical protein
VVIALPEDMLSESVVTADASAFEPIAHCRITDLRTNQLLGLTV